MMPINRAGKPARYGILVCQALRREVAAAVAAIGLNEVRVVIFAARCGQPGLVQSRFDRILQHSENRFDRFLVIGGTCLAQTDRLAALQNQDRATVLPGCFELFLPGPLVEHYQRQGVYLLTPGWLRHWRRRMAEWRFDSPTARAFFAESCSRLLLLDTGVEPGAPNALRDLANFVDRPSEIIPVGLDLLEARLAQSVGVWRATTQTCGSGPAVETPLADYAAVFDLMGRLTGFETEDKVHHAFFELFEMMCAPAAMAFLPVSDGQPGRLLIWPPIEGDVALYQYLADFHAPYAWTDSGAGFIVRIGRGAESMGVLWVERVALPRHRERYLNFALAIMPAMALALSNARNFERLEQKNAELERFAYLISHDLKSPLITVKTFLGYLSQDLGRSDFGRVERDLSYMRTAVDKMGQLLDDLLEFSRAGRMAHPAVRITFRQIVDEVLRLVAGSIAAHGVAVRVSDDAVALVGDAPRLMDLWQNLVENAVKYLGEQPAPCIEIGIERHERDIYFFVRDNGMGIDPQYQEKVFGLFEKLDPNSEGTGLGLALVKRIVERYRGAVWLESAGLGQGVCVWFTLPGAVEEPCLATATDAAIPGSLV